jgi:RHS repeat-associated protein
MQTYGYDHGLRLTNITSAAGPFGYNYQAGKPALLNRLSLPSGPYVDYGFDHMDRLTNQVCRAAGGAVIDAYGRLFNVASQPTRQTRNDGSYVDLAYDKLGQLTNAVGREAGGTFRSHEQLSYKYDPAGNLLYRTNNGFVQSFSVNARNELGTVTRSGTFTASGSTLPATTNLTVNSLSGTLYGDASYASAGHTLADGTNIFTAVALGVGLATTNRAETVLPATVSHTYDPNGNLTSDGLRGFEYDEDNQLVAITRTNQWRSEFIYDGTGRRRIRRELKWAVSTWLITNEVRYVYSGMLVIQERDISNMPLVSYTRGMDLSGTQQGAGGIGGLLARTDHTTITALFQTTFYLSDHSGNVATLVTTNGQRAAHYLYDPYGNLLAASGPLADANLYRASSKELHAYSGLVYFGKRYYSPALQRWINQDPISELGGLNLHVFAANTPAARYDGWGHQALSLKRLKELANNSHGFDSLFSHPSLEIVVSCGSTGFFSARSPASNSPKTGAANSSMGGTIPDAVRTIPVVGMVLAPVAQVIVGAAKTIGGLLTLSGNRISGGLMDMFGGIVGRNGVFGQGWLDLPGLLRPGGTVETYAAKLNAEALSEGLDYAVNDNKYGHANAASKAQSDLGIAGIPLVVAGNVYYEAQHAFMPGHNPGTDPTYHRSDFKFLGLADGQNPLSWVYDTPGDILAASFGQLTGLLLPLRNTSAVNKSVFLIPGPDYRGTDDWEQLCYPGAACPWR